MFPSSSSGVHGECVCKAVSCSVRVPLAIIPQGGRGGAGGPLPLISIPGTIGEVDRPFLSGWGVQLARQWPSFGGARLPPHPHPTEPEARRRAPPGPCPPLPMADQCGGRWASTIPECPLLRHGVRLATALSVTIDHPASITVMFGHSSLPIGDLGIGVPKKPSPWALRRTLTMNIGARMTLKVDSLHDDCDSK